MIEMKEMKNLKVLVIGGESYNIGWSENDFSSILKNKLDGISDGAQVNVVEQILLNGQIVAVTEKTVDLGNLQKQLTPGTGINIAEDGTISTTLDVSAFKIVESLPEAPDTGNENKIHVVPNVNGASNDMYNEYLWDGSKWELIGSFKAEVDLSEYAKTSYVDEKVGEVTETVNAVKEELNESIGLKADKTYVDEELAKKVDKTEGKDLSSNDYITEDKEKLAGIAAGANKVTTSYDESTFTLTVEIS